ncbi:Acg family FMN-binding oxidoreductase [Geodermatophilus sp. FMUSA9-8]|uniref:Acg family FMN-binding oxidoreductase n=1 Tax=Geodermatophilus sp. FMUSA9-8 TaxID=3120155 RepID=UPI0030082DC3
MARPSTAPSPAPDRRSRVPATAPLEAAADAATSAPSVHNTQPWRIVLHTDRLELFADRARQLPVLDPLGRALTLSVGAALFNARVALAAAGVAVRVDRLPDLDGNPQLMAVLRPVDGPADPALATLAPAVRRRRTNRRRYAPGRVPEDLLRVLVAAAAAEETTLVPVTRDHHVRLLARLTQQADGMQNADPAYRAELRRWTNRDPRAGDGVPASAVPHVDGHQHDALPVRDFDTAGAGLLPPDTDSGTHQTLVVLATPRDDLSAWLRCGEALERVLLELTTHGWVAGPLTQAVEVPVTRTQLRAALTWDTHPQAVLRIGRAPATSPTPRRPRATVVENSAASTGRQITGRVQPAAPARTPARPVPDGRGGTTWR